MSALPSAEDLLSETHLLNNASDTGICVGQMKNVAFYLDRQFRLLRQDLIYALREEIQGLMNERESHRRGFCVENLTLVGAQTDCRYPWSLQFRCLEDLPQLRHKGEPERRSFIQENTKFLKHESSVFVVVDGKLLTLGTLIREVDHLCQSPPLLNVRIPQTELYNILSAIKDAKQIALFQLHTAIFAYEPVLKRLSGMTELPLEEDLLRWTIGKVVPPPNYQFTAEFSRLREDFGVDPSLQLTDILNLPSPVKLDRSQGACFLAGLRQRVALIQGPPGTGKSFIGSLITKAILDCSTENILLVCYTHHALDQFLEDLLDQGIQESDIIRLGSIKKATPRTQTLSLNKARNITRLSQSQRNELEQCKMAAKKSADILHKTVADVHGTDIPKSEILKHIGALPDLPPFFSLLRVPQRGRERERGQISTPVLREEPQIEQFYLLDRWCRGKDPGKLKSYFNARSKKHGKGHTSNVWDMPAPDRMKVLKKWKDEMRQAWMKTVHDTGSDYNACVQRLTAIHTEKDITIIKRKRIIACTTTAAAKYAQTIQSAAPAVVLVEEAGQILESHIVTAIGPHTKQLILIGDHKQLRPRVHFSLSVEKGDGYDLNRSTFERLILQGYPHHVLSQQHRMRPEISAILRELAYPNLTDSPRTLHRPHMRGLRDNVIFVSHKMVESEMNGAPEWRDIGSTSSKRNVFEARMALQCVRYLGQQGYGMDNIAILTPYMGQLRLLHDELQKENDPVLNDLDSRDLWRAGLMPTSTTNLGKPRIRISTIDNFQGDESDIVVVSLTRSNPRRDIGFMAAAERLIVLLSRARDGLILIGDAETFRESRAAGSLWRRFTDMLVARKHMYKGLPTRCERHKTSVALVSAPEEFDQKCPGGGCSQPCEAIVGCGIHVCPRTCHEPYDHSKILCQWVVQWVCPRSHVVERKCHKQSYACDQCSPDDLRQQDLIEIPSSALDTGSSRLNGEFSSLLERRYGGQARLQGGREGLCARVFCRQVATGRVSLGAADLAALEHAWSAVEKRQALRLEQEHAANNANVTDEFSFTIEDFIGPEPHRTLQLSDPWEKLQNLIGLKKVKESITTMVNLLQLRYELELKEKPTVEVNLSRLFLGSPGTGKTTVGRLYAAILGDLGLVSSSDVVLKDPADFIGRTARESEENTNDILEESKEKVLIIEEAWALSEGGRPDRDPCRAVVIEKIMFAIGSKQEGGQCILLLGSRGQMERMLEASPTLNTAGGFPLSSAFQFDGLGDEELHQLLELMLQRRRVTATDGAKQAALKRLREARGRPNFGNAGAVETLVSIAVSRYKSRRLSKPGIVSSNSVAILLEEDFHENIDPRSALSFSTTAQLMETR